MLPQVDVNKVWLSFSSVFLAFVFVFGNSLRNMYESVIFLFVMHPYDVGDALFISGDWCQVEEIALQYTQVVRYDGVKIWYPNYVLCAGAVMNITRSAKRWESFKVSCCFTRCFIDCSHDAIACIMCKFPGGAWKYTMKASDSVQYYSNKANPPCQMAYSCVVEPV